VFVDYWSGPGAWSALPASRRVAVAERMPKVRAEFEALFDDDVEPAAYAALTMPTVVLVGDRSPQPARQVAQRLVQACRHTRLVHLSRRGHMGALEDPAAVLRHLPLAATVLPAAA
jgi:pimeloyl-ACP methyl ester carboxylesterase